MNLATRYDKHSIKWSSMLDRRGFSGAYRNFFDGLNLPVSGSAVCDLGTGCGDFAKALCSSKGQPASLTLVDPSAAMLQQAESQLRNWFSDIETIHSPLEALPTTTQFDIVLAAHVIEHCADPYKALSKMYGLLKPGGTLVLSVSKPHFCQWIIWLVWQHCWYSEFQMRSLIAASRFSAATCHAYSEGIPQRISLAYVARRPTMEG
ncbi:MAG: class I SAM-dependent methyltransferase [Roseibium sp.]